MTSRLVYRYLTLVCLVIGSGFADDRTRTNAVTSSKSTGKVIPVNTDNLTPRNSDLVALGFFNSQRENGRPEVDQIGVNSAGISSINFEEDEDMIPVKIRTVGSPKKFLPINKKNFFFVNNRKIRKPVDIEQMGVNAGSLTEVNSDEDAGSHPYSITVTDNANKHDEDWDAGEDNTEFALLQPRRGGGRGGGGHRGGGHRGGGRRSGRGRRFGRPGRGRRFRRPFFVDNVDEVDPVDEDDS